MSTSSLKRRRGADTRDVILQAARRLFARYGYDSTTTRMIAKEAGVAEGTIYVYFPSKRHLLLFLLEQATLPVLEDIFADTTAATDTEVLKSLFRDRIEFGRTHAGVLRTLLSQAMYDEQLAEQLVREVLVPAGSLLKHYLTRRMEDGAFRKAEVDIAARMAVGAFWFTILFDHLLACSEDTKSGLLKRYSAEQYAEEFTNLFLEGVRK